MGARVAFRGRNGARAGVHAPPLTRHRQGCQPLRAPGREHLIWEYSDQDILDNTRVFEVPPEHFFLMGDNRDSSQDSRVMPAVGFVPFENLIGRAEFLFFSHDDSAGLFKIWTWPAAIRFSRIFDGVE